MRKSVIITGATGMVGKSVLLECIEDSRIEQILLINRSPINIHHTKIKEIILDDFIQIDKHVEDLIGYDACYFCMGVSVVGLTEEKYKQVTYNITSAFVNVLKIINPSMLFIYVSGAGTDSTEKGKVMWARVKGKTENLVLSSNFRDAYAFRPGIILPEKGIESKTNWYNWAYIVTRPLFPVFRLSKNITTTTNLGKAMIQLLFKPYGKKHVSNADINKIVAESD